MKFPVLLLSSIFLTVLLAHSASAATTVISGQQAIEFAVQSGQNHSFYLVFTNVDPSNITASGDLASWVRFGDSATTSHTFSSFSSLTALLVTIQVPAGTADSQVKGFINADNIIVSQLTATVVPSLANISALRTLADVNAQLGTLKGQLTTISQQVDNSKSDIIESTTDVEKKIDAIVSTQDTVSSLQRQNAELESRIIELKKNTSVQAPNKESAALKTELDRVTGQVTTQNNFSFAAGFLVGAVILYLISNRRSLRLPFRFRMSPHI